MFAVTDSPCLRERGHSAVLSLRGAVGCTLGEGKGEVNTVAQNTGRVPSGCFVGNPNEPGANILVAVMLLWDGLVMRPPSVPLAL